MLTLIRRKFLPVFCFLILTTIPSISAAKKMMVFTYCAIDTSNTFLEDETLRTKKRVLIDPIDNLFVSLIDINSIKTNEDLLKPYAKHICNELSTEKISDKDAANKIFAKGMYLGICQNDHVKAEIKKAYLDNYELEIPVAVREYCHRGNNEPNDIDTAYLQFRIDTMCEYAEDYSRIISKRERYWAYDLEVHKLPVFMEIKKKLTSICGKLQTKEISLKEARRQLELNFDKWDNMYKDQLKKLILSNIKNKFLSILKFFGIALGVIGTLVAIVSGFANIINQK